MHTPRTLASIWIDVEQQVVCRTTRVIRARHIRCWVLSHRSMFGATSNHRV
jgi:hypothetical protein